VDGEFFLRQRVKHLLVEFQKSGKWTRRLADEVREFLLLDAPEVLTRPSPDILRDISTAISSFAAGHLERQGQRHAAGALVELSLSSSVGGALLVEKYGAPGYREGSTATRRQALKWVLSKTVIELNNMDPPASLGKPHSEPEGRIGPALTHLGASVGDLPFPPQTTVPESRPVPSESILL